MVTRKDLSATAGIRSIRSRAGPTSIPRVSNAFRMERPRSPSTGGLAGGAGDSADAGSGGGHGVVARAASRCIRGRSPSRTDIGMETGNESNSASYTWRSRLRVASPTSAHGQRSRSHSAAKSAIRPGSMART